MAALWELRDKDALLLEAENRLGGRLKSSPRGDYWLNQGGHLFPGAGSHIQNLLDAVGLETIPIPGIKTAMEFEAKVYKYQRVEWYPIRLPLTLGERIAFSRAGLRVMAGVRRWQKEIKSRPQEGEEERRIRVADYLSDRRFIDLLGKLPARIDKIFRAAGRRTTGELEEQAASSGISIFGAVWAGDKSTMALNLNGGSGRLGDAFLHRLGDRIKLQARVTRVRKAPGGVLVSYGTPDGDTEVLARHAIVAVPPPIAHHFVEDIPADLAKLLVDIVYGPFVALSLITNETTPMPYDNLYALTVPTLSFDMFFNHANPLRGTGPRKPGGSLMMYAAGQPAREMLKKTDEEVKETFLADLYRMFPEVRGHVTEAVVQRWEVGNHFRTPGLSFEPMLRYCARPGNTIHFAGDYFAELGNMEISAGTAVEAARRVRSQLAATDS